MNQYVRGMGVVLTLTLGVVLVAGHARAFNYDDAAEVKKAQKDILDLAALLEEGKSKDIEAKAAAIRKKYEELNTVMHAYKPSEKGGIGYGTKRTKGDGIELKIISLGKRALPAASLTKDKEDLLKMAHVNLAMGHITDAYAPSKPKAGKGAKEWKAYNTEMIKATKDLIEAVNGANAQGVKTAAANINNACNNCHTDFRD